MGQLIESLLPNLIIKKTSKQEPLLIPMRSSVAKQEPKIKLTKLEKFLSRIEPSTLLLMRKYIHDHSQEYDNLKYDKIKLVHDLYMIVKFKDNEAAIIDKKKIDDICQQLSQEFGFSTTTIRERVQKKLADVSQADLIEHVKLGVGFTFNTRRQLMPVRSFGQERYSFRAYDSKELIKPQVKWEDGKIEDRQAYPKIQTKHPKEANHSRQPQLSIGPQKTMSSEPAPQCDYSEYADLYNQFREDVEQFKQDMILVRQTENSYKVVSLSRNNDEDIVKQLDQMTEEEIKRQNDEEQNEDRANEKQSKSVSQEATQQANDQQNGFNGGTDFGSPQIQQTPTKSSIYPQKQGNQNQVFGLMGEKCDKKHSQGEHSRWVPEEDEYLIDCLNCQGVMEEWEIIQKLQTLRKFKLGSDILERVKFLERQISMGLMAWLLSESD